MSKPELINRDLEYEDNGTPESETSDDEYMMNKLQPYMYKPCVSKESVKDNCPGKKPSDLQESASRIGNTLWCSCGKYKLMATHVESICCLDVCVCVCVYSLPP